MSEDVRDLRRQMICTTRSSPTTVRKQKAWAVSCLVVTSAGSVAHAGDISAPTRNYLLSEQDPLRHARISSAGIAANVVLGAPCNDTSYYVFGTTSWGRLVFCGSPRRYEPRYFRAMSMVGVKELNTNCSGRENEMAQAPDGLFLTCVPNNGEAVWARGVA